MHIYIYIFIYMYICIYKLYKCLLHWPPCHAKFQKPQEVLNGNYVYITEWQWYIKTIEMKNNLYWCFCITTYEIILKFHVNYKEK